MQTALRGARNRYQFEINVEREWNAVKYQNRNTLFYLLNTGVSRKVQVLSSAPELKGLFEAANRVCGEKFGKAPALMVLKQRAASS